VSQRRGNWHATGKNIRTLKLTTADAVADALHDGALAAAVSHGGDAGPQSGLGISERALEQTFLRIPRYLFDDGSVRGLGGKHQVHVGIDQARKDGAAGEIESLTGAACRIQETLLDAFNPLSADPHQGSNQRGCSRAIPKSISCYQ
jgi:hypothetical protein